MVSIVIATHIVKYLLEKQNKDIFSISKEFDTTEEHILNIIRQKESLPEKNLLFYLNKNNTKMWELLEEAVPEEILSEKIKNKIIICKSLSKIIDDKNNSSIKK